MNEIKRYTVTGFSFDPVTNSLNTKYAEVTDATQPVCMWSDVEPIVQHNKELEAELARLREHVDSLSCGVSRDEWHDKAWSLLYSCVLKDSEIMKVNIHTIRTVFNATYDALANSALIKPKPAQIPAEIVAFINTFPELNMSNYSDDDIAELNVWGIELVQMVKGKS